MADTSLSVVELFMVFKYNKNNNVEFVGGQAMLLNIYNYFRREMNSGTILGYFLQALPIACRHCIFRNSFCLFEEKEASN